MSRRDSGLIFFAALLSMLGYAAVSWLTFRPGFPLDDAWIHQTYARNLANHGEWAYVAGEPSAGSTAPAWSALLAVGYLLKLDPKLWAFLIGWASLAGLGMVSAQGMRYLVPGATRWAIWAGLAMILEWHLVWAALSGMETVLYSLLALFILVSLVRHEWQSKGQSMSDAGQRRWMGLGGLIGFAIWVRPDAVTLLAPVGLYILIAENSIQRKTIGLLNCLAGCVVFVIPYMLFNRALAGAWLPNTFFAKQAEYAVHREIPLWIRFLDQFKLPLVGVGMILVPAFGYFLIRSGSMRAVSAVLGGLWALGYLAIYALRLPVTYQHGRYIMPAMPEFFLWGLAGLIALCSASVRSARPRLLMRAWALSASAVLIAFWFAGARAYAADVAIIETELVETARWVQRNTSSQMVIAAHDIGALGYFAERSLIDLAGLVSPEVIPFIRDEQAIREYLNRSGADYLVTFPGWYPSLVKQVPVVYVSAGEFSPKFGGENLAVYLWR